MPSYTSTAWAPSNRYCVPCEDGIQTVAFRFHPVFSQNFYHLWVSFPPRRCFVLVNISLLAGSLNRRNCFADSLFRVISQPTRFCPQPQWLQLPTMGRLPPFVCSPRRLNRRKSAQRTLPVSPDLTSDEIPAKGGHRLLVLGQYLRHRRPSEARTQAIIGCLSSDSTSATGGCPKFVHRRSSAVCPPFTQLS